MGYFDVGELAVDQDFRARIAACATSEAAALDKSLGMHPLTFADTYQWQVAGAPGFGDAYASALAADPPVERPGADPSVISDAQILTVVQPLVVALPDTPTTPGP